MFHHVTLPASPLPKRSYPVVVPLEASAAVQKSRSRNLIHGHPCRDRVVTSDLNSSRPIDLIERNEETIHQPTVRSSSIRIAADTRQSHLPSLYGPSLSGSIAVIQKKKKDLLKYNRIIGVCLFYGKSFLK